jgi:DNA-binding CsgD family transcriptional regulator
MREMSEQKHVPSQWGLTTREKEVAWLLAEGHSYNEISAVLSLSPHTVATHVKAILKKTGLKTSRRLASVLHARRST